MNLDIIAYIIKGIKNGCPCIVGVGGTQGYSLVENPARAVQESSQGTTLSAILNPFCNMGLALLTLSYNKIVVN